MSAARRNIAHDATVDQDECACHRCLRDTYEGSEEADEQSFGEFAFRAAAAHHGIPWNTNVDTGQLPVMAMHPESWRKREFADWGDAYHFITHD